MTDKDFHADGTMKWERWSPPVWWPAAGRHVIADRHLPDGTRQHMVEGHVAPGTMVDNADVIGSADVPHAEFLDTPRRLAAVGQ